MQWGRRGQCRAIHTRNGAQHDLRRRHGCPSIARGHEPMGAPLPHQAEANTHGTVALGADRFHLIVHGDAFAGMDNVNGQAGDRAMAVQFGPDDILRAHQQDGQAELTCGLDRALNFWLGSAFGSHRVQRDHARHGV